MRSPKGFLAAIIFLLAAPAAILCQIIFHIDAELIIHFVCGAGFALLSFSVFDFRIPVWVKLIGCAATGVLAFIFLLQGVSGLVKNGTLHYLAFDILGQRLEGVLVRILLLWFAALLVFDSRGRTRIFGIVVMAIVFCVEVYGYYLSYLGAEAPILKLFYLLPFVWFLFESKKERFS